MNRKVLWRGKYIATDEWVYGNLQQYSDGCDIDEQPVHPDTVGQYITTDHKNSPLYEGDLVWTNYRQTDFFDADRKLAEIVWSEKRQAFLARSGISAILLSDIVMSGSKLEVRGNIYD